MTIQTPILPSKLHYAKKHEAHEVHFEAICIFAATGFFLDDDTYFKGGCEKIETFIQTLLSKE